MTLRECHAPGGDQSQSGCGGEIDHANATQRTFAITTLFTKSTCSALTWLSCSSNAFTLAAKFRLTSRRASTSLRCALAALTCSSNSEAYASSMYGVILTSNASRTNSFVRYLGRSGAEVDVRSGAFDVFSRRCADLVVKKKQVNTWVKPAGKSTPHSRSQGARRDRAPRTHRKDGF